MSCTVMSHGSQLVRLLSITRRNSPLHVVPRDSASVLRQQGPNLVKASKTWDGGWGWCAVSLRRGGACGWGALRDAGNREAHGGQPVASLLGDPVALEVLALCDGDGAELLIGARDAHREVGVLEIRIRQDAIHPHGYTPPQRRRRVGDRGCPLVLPFRRHCWRVAARRGSLLHRPARVVVLSKPLEVWGRGGGGGLGNFIVESGSKQEGGGEGGRGSGVMRPGASNMQLHGGIL